MGTVGSTSSMIALLDDTNDLTIISPGFIMLTPNANYALGFSVPVAGLQLNSITIPISAAPEANGNDVLLTVSGVGADIALSLTPSTTSVFITLPINTPVQSGTYQLNILVSEPLRWHCTILSFHTFFDF
jgi:hypothetical protein